MSAIPSRAEVKKLYEEKARIDEQIKNISPESEKLEPPKIIDYNDEDYTDVGNAKRFVALHQRNIRYVSVWKSWMVWDKCRWVQKSSDQMTPYVEEMTKQMRVLAGHLPIDKGDKLLKFASSSESYTRMIACIKLARNHEAIQAEPDDFDKDKYLLNFQNGTVELRTGTLREFRRDDMITRIADVPCKSGLRPLWDSSLERFFAGDKEMIQYIQKFLGMAITGDVSEELFHIFHGGGANFKTTLLTTINRILGSVYFKTVAAESLMRRGQKTMATDIARLEGARVAWANEPEFNDVLTEGKIKKMTSKERILGEAKYKMPAEFAPEFTLILTCNRKPRVAGMDGGWLRRLRFIPFTVSISEDEKDIHFAEKLEPELPAIAAWIVEGCVLWQKDGLEPTDKILSATNEYTEEMDRFAPFFNILTVPDTSAKTPHALLYTIYKLWAQEEEMVVMSKIGFTQMLLDRPTKPKIEAKTARYADGRQFRGFAGIAIDNTPVTVYIDKSVTIKMSLLESVTEYFQATNSEKQEKFETLLLIIRSKVNPFSIEGSCARDKTVTSVTSVTNDMQSNTGLFSQSVTSVTLVTEQAKNLLKERYDKSKLDDLMGIYKTYDKIKDAMELYLLTEFKDDEGDFMKSVTDYCRVREWEK